MGTIINAVLIVVGAVVGLLIKNGIREVVKESLLKVEGVALFIIGLNGVISSMFSVESNKISSDGGLLLLISLVIGTFVGEILRIDQLCNLLGNKIEKKFGKEGFSKGFVDASLVFCIGSMGIIGAINDGIYGDYNLLFMKGIIDAVTAAIMASTLGYGVAFSSLPILLYQGSITLAASSLSSLVDTTSLAMSQFTMVGYSIIVCIGFNFIFDSKIRTANMVPAIFVPIIYNLFI